MKQATDRPPILRFLAMFVGLLAVAIGLAALSPPVDGTVDASLALGQQRAQPAAAAAHVNPR